MGSPCCLLRAPALLQQRKNEKMQAWVEDLTKKYKSKTKYAEGFAPPALPEAPTTTAAPTTTVAETTTTETGGAGGGLPATGGRNGSLPTAIILFGTGLALLVIARRPTTLRH